MTAPQATHTFVYVSTIQRMTINLFGYENTFGQRERDADCEEEAGALDILNRLR